MTVAVANPTRATTHRHPPGSLCLLCGAILGRASARGGPSRGVCGGCAERLELELTSIDGSACGDCGRHNELCAVMPCNGSRSEPIHADSESPSVAWLPIAQIDDTPDDLNARKVYDTPSLVELAASIKEHGILQPLCVRPAGNRYVLVFGNRRLRAARRAGIDVVPCMIQPAADDRAFLLNVVENLHRRQLSGVERVRAIERLAATQLGVRELGRRTGFAPSTISRWLKINRCPELKLALETDRLDIGRAKLLADAPQTVLVELIVLAPRLSRADLSRRIAAERGEPGPVNLVPYGPSPDSRRLQRAVRTLESVSHVGPEDVQVLEHLRDLVDGLLTT